MKTFLIIILLLLWLDAMDKHEAQARRIVELEGKIEQLKCVQE
jgi:hypothetical protein